MWRPSLFDLVSGIPCTKPTCGGSSVSRAPGIGPYSTLAYWTVGAVSCYDLARDLAGTLKGLPKDLCDIVYDVRIVLDTDAVIAAMRSPAGASAAIIRAVRERQATLLLSVPLAIEYEAVCRRPEHRVEAGLSSRQVEIFLDA